MYICSLLFWRPGAPLAPKWARQSGYIQSASRDLRRGGPNPGKILALPIMKKVPGPPNPWNKSCADNHCDPNWAVGQNRFSLTAPASLAPWGTP